MSKTLFRPAIIAAALVALCYALVFFIIRDMKHQETFASLLTANQHRMRGLSTWITDMHQLCEKKGPYSQGAQDYYLERIFCVLGETNRYFVEFGFNVDSYESGGSGANTGSLFMKGWRGLLLDAGHQNPAINLQRHWLFASNIVEIFRSNNVPIELDFLSVDMDSHDIWVTQAILEAGYRPRVISTEYNSNYPLNVGLTLMDPSLLQPAYQADRFKFEFSGCAWGASAKALHIMVQRYGYVLVGRVELFDLFWIRADLIENWMHLPDFDWFFRDMPIDVLHHLPQTTLVAVDQLVDYETYLRTGDFNASNQAARDTIKKNDMECFREISNQL